MRLINPSFEILEQEEGLEGVYKQIEKVGRTCYKSEDKIAEGTAKPFVGRMIKSGHGAMLEHGTVYLMVHTIDPKDWDKKIARHHRITIDDARENIRTNPTYNNVGEENWWAKEADHIAYKMAVKYADNPYSKVKIVSTKHTLNTEGKIIITPTNELPVVAEAPDKIVSVFNTFLITTNLRVLVENNWMDDLKYLCEPTEYHEKRVTVKFITDQGILREFTRHRVFSFAVESTRYCNYSKGKFNSEITFINPCWYSTSLEYNTFKAALIDAENRYMKLIEAGWTPQQARNVLPLATKCDMVMTGFVDDWDHFFDLRTRGTTGAPHPQAKELAEPLLTEFIKRDLVSL